MGHTTWEQVFSWHLAESANSTMISASGGQEPRAFAAAERGGLLKAAGMQCLTPGRGPAPLHWQWLLQKSPAAAAPAPQRRPLLTPRNSSATTRLTGGSDDPLQGQEIQWSMWGHQSTRGHQRPWSSPLLSKLKLNFHLNDTAPSLLL